jgi:hypothetical protein
VDKTPPVSVHKTQSHVRRFQSGLSLGSRLRTPRGGPAPLRNPAH